VSFYWQICDPDAEAGTTFAEGHGDLELLEALMVLTDRQTTATPEGFTPSGNVALYWSQTPTRAEARA
jgi:hypothetical protein